MDSQPLSRHERNKRRTRKQLEQAVFDLLLIKGYDAITIQDIVDHADVGRGTFYLHFRDKEEAVWSLVEQSLQETDMLAHQVVDQDPSKATLQRALINMFTYVENNRDLFRIMLGSQGNAAITQKVQNWLAADIIKEVRESNPDLPEGEVPLTVVAQILTGAITRLAIWWLETPNVYTAEVMAGMAYQTLANGLNWK